MAWFRWLSIIASMLFVLSSDLTAEDKIEFHAPVGTDGVQRIELVGGSYFFHPNKIVVKVNVPVEMRIKKEAGMTPHNFVLKAPEAGLDIRLELTKDPQTVRFIPKQIGQYTFYCDKKPPLMKSHKDKGMIGDFNRGPLMNSFA